MVNAATNDARPPYNIGDLFLRGLPSPAAAHQVDGGAELEQWIIGGLKAVNAWNRVKDDLFLLVLVVAHRASKLDDAQLHGLSIFRPVNGRIVHHIAIVRQ